VPGGGPEKKTVFRDLPSVRLGIHGQFFPPTRGRVRVAASGGTPSLSIGGPHEQAPWPVFIGEGGGGRRLCRKTKGTGEPPRWSYAIRDRRGFWIWGVRSRVRRKPRRLVGSGRKTGVAPASKNIHGGGNQTPKFGSRWAQGATGGGGPGPPLLVVVLAEGLACRKSGLGHGRGDRQPSREWLVQAAGADLRILYFLVQYV